jgi:1-aminocyclopropane-1-carboxylate deaminase/D-cysteine desulfhydrase-like pyridoxal-dependent ACC family enzyme
MSFHPETEKLVNKACVYELAQAVLEHGDNFHSRHEGYAVLKEEVEEAWEEVNYIENNLLDFVWEKVTKGFVPDGTINEIQEVAIRGMKELAQVWAVCEKMKEK